MNSFVSINPNGQFALDGRRWFCNSVVYFGHQPGAMQNWFTDDVWHLNEPRLEYDFERMQRIGLNHSALFLTNAMFFEGGKPVDKGFERMQRVVDVAKAHGVRLTLFSGPFIDNEDEYFRITGRKWEHGDHWLPTFNPDLFDAYVAMMKPLAERYRDEPAVLGYGDRIDRFFKGFDNVSIPHNLKEEWAAWLKARYGKFSSLIESVGGPEVLENRPADFDEVLLPQESRWNASLKNPLAYDYILWQKKDIGDAQARWDAEIEKIAPHQVMWTPFEGPTLDWPMLDGFTPETHKLRAIWMEYYHWQAVRPHPVGPFEEWAHTREFVTYRMAHESPSIYNIAYAFARYVKLSTQRPVVICHGGRLDNPLTGADNEIHQLAVVDRVNTACLDADADGWHYWCWTDDWQSSLSHKREQKAEPTAMYWQGESTGLHDWDDDPRPVVPLVTSYSAELRRRVVRNAAPRRSEVLILSSAAKMYNLYRRLAVPLAGSISGALARLGAQADYLWTAQNDFRIDPSTLAQYKLIVVADNMLGRDFADTPQKLLQFVESGGTLYFALDAWDKFEDEHGVSRPNDAIRQLSGIDPDGSRDWPGAGEGYRNWPFPGETPHEPGFDALQFPRLQWGICPYFRHISPQATKTQMLGFRSADDDHFTAAPGLVSGAEVIAVAKFANGTKPFVWRHPVGAGTVYVNAWTNTVIRDSDRRPDYGGWEYDWLLSLPLETSGAEDVDLTRGAGVWLRNTWGYFWKDM